MADKTIGDLTQAESIGGEDLFVLQQNGEAKKLKGSQLIDYVTFNVISVTVETLPAGSQATATYNEATGTLSLGIPQGEQGNIGPANTLTIGTVTSGAEASATITGDAPNQVLNLVLQQGEQGDAAPTITNIAIRQSDYHMIVTLSDGTSYDAGYCRGASGAGTGDMLASIYDPQNKAQDIFSYVDNAISGVTKSDVGLGNVDNVKQYSASNPPPYPVTSVNGNTGDVTVDGGGSFVAVYDQSTFTDVLNAYNDGKSVIAKDSFGNQYFLWEVQTGYIVFCKPNASAASFNSITINSSNQWLTSTLSPMGRTNNVNEENTNYTTYMARGEALFNAETNPTVNGTIAWVYE